MRYELGSRAPNSQCSTTYGDLTRLYPGFIRSSSYIGHRQPPWSCKMSEELSAVTLELDKEVLPLYFKHDNLRSFIRQLNIYGFQRVPNASGRDRTMEFFHPMFTRNGVRNLKDIKRGNQIKKQDDDGETQEAEPAPAQAPPAKKQRTDYSTFKDDVARLQKNLQDFEQDLKEHTSQVQQKLAYILSALDDPIPSNEAGSHHQAPMIQHSHPLMGNS